MSADLLVVRQLGVYLGPQQALRAVDGVDLTLAAGKTLAIVGESGCGKSMTALALMGLLPPGAQRQGDILFRGEALPAAPNHPAWRRLRGAKMAMIFQDPMTSLNPVFTVGQQIAESVQRHQGLRGAALHKAVLALMAAVGIPDPQRRVRDYPHQMSGGMKQRIMIAMALGGQPELLIADEPTTALDVTIQAQLLQLLQQLQQERGMAILLITHDLGVVAQLADEVAVMYAGQIIETAPQPAFFAQPAHPYSQKLFAALPDQQKRQQRLAMIPGQVPRLNQPFTGCRFANRCEQALLHCAQQIPPWQRTDQRQVRCHLPNRFDANPAALAVALSPLPAADHATLPPVTNAFNAVENAVENALALPHTQTQCLGPPPLLAVHQLKMRFGAGKSWFGRTNAWVQAVEEVSFHIQSGQTLALVGESGCGKSTVAKGLLQLLPVVQGDIRWAGQDLRQFQGKALLQQRKNMQMIFQDAYASMNPRLTVGAIIEEGMIIQNLYPRAERQARVKQLLQQVGLDASAGKRYPHEFSGGQRQRICIARALAVEPALIICDEPTSALDVSVQAQILNLLQELQQQLRLSLLFITHNMAVVAYLAHEVAVMYLGRIVERGPVALIFNQPLHPYTKALLASVPDLYQRRTQPPLQGDLPSPIHPPAGCHFHPRCPQAQAICRQQIPPVSTLADQRQVRCFFAMPT